MRIALPHHPEETPMLRIGKLLSIFALLLIPITQSAVLAQNASVPAYFFNQWTVQSNCIQQGFDPAEQTQVGLQYLHLARERLRGRLKLWISADQHRQPGVARWLVGAGAAVPPRNSDDRHSG
jgi:hypothetical protein